MSRLVCSAPPPVHIPVDELREYITRWRARILLELGQVIFADRDDDLAAAYVRANTRRTTRVDVDVCGPMNAPRDV